MAYTKTEAHRHHRFIVHYFICIHIFPGEVHTYLVKYRKYHTYVPITICAREHRSGGGTVNIWHYNCALTYSVHGSSSTPLESSGGHFKGCRRGGDSDCGVFGVNQIDVVVDIAVYLCIVGPRRHDATL